MTGKGSSGVLLNNVPYRSSVAMTVEFWDSLGNDGACTNTYWTPLAWTFYKKKKKRFETGLKDGSQVKSTCSSSAELELGSASHMGPLATAWNSTGISFIGTDPHSKAYVHI